MRLNGGGENVFCPSLSFFFLLDFFWFVCDRFFCWVVSGFFRLVTFLIMYFFCYVFCDLLSDCDLASRFVCSFSVRFFFPLWVIFLFYFFVLFAFTCTDAVPSVLFHLIVDICFFVCFVHRFTRKKEKERKTNKGKNQNVVEVKN